MTVSVIIPSYNRESFVGRTIESVLGQTHPPEEILVVDDGSQDDTRSLVATFTERSAGRVRYIYRENGGLSAARNTGQQQATPQCDALLFLDSDDLLEPTTLAKLGAALDANPQASLAFCRARYIGADDTPVVIPNTALIDEPSEGDMWRHLIKSNCIRSAGGVLLRRDALNAVEPWDEELRSNEDWDMWLRLAETGRPFARVSEPLLLYRVHGNNMSGNREVMRATGLRVYEKQLERHQNDPVKVAEIQRHYAACFVPDVHGVGANSGGMPDYMVLPGGGANLSYDTAAQNKHLRLRSMIERTGVASLYRKTPMALRLKLRVLFGIDPNA